MKKIFLIVLIMTLSIFISGCEDLINSSLLELEIVLEGDQLIELNKGETFVDPGYYVYNTYDEDIDDTVVVTGDVDINNSGVYTITYTVNYEGLQAINHRYIVVWDSDQYIPIDDSVLYPEGDGMNLEVHFINLNPSMGDSTLINIGDFEILIDAGFKSSGTNVVVPYLEDYVEDGVIEIVIATHPDSDHISGFVGLSGELGVLDAYNMDYIIDYGYDGATEVHDEYEALKLLEYTNGTKYCTGIDSIEGNYGCRKIYKITNEITLEILETSMYGVAAERNESSIVTLLTYNDVNFLFTGDLEDDGEEFISQYLGHVDIYKAGHHGSGTCSTLPLLNAITPDTVIMSASMDNSYGIPPQDSIDRIYGFTDQVYMTFVNGNIVITTDGSTYSVAGELNNLLFQESDWFINNRILPTS